jgi:hypothetical protein
MFDLSYDYPATPGFPVWPFMLTIYARLTHHAMHSLLAGSLLLFNYDCESAKCRPKHKLAGHPRLFDDNGRFANRPIIADQGPATRIRVHAPDFRVKEPVQMGHENGDARFCLC